MADNPLFNVEIPESAGQVAKDVYNDLGHPISTELGQAAGTVLGLLNTALTPIKLLNSVAKAKADKFISDYQEGLSSIPKEKYCDPNPVLIGPMAEHAKYKITEDTLRESCLALMLASSNSDNLCKPLLAFDNILNQLTPIEVKLLKHLFFSLPKQVYPVSNIKKISDSGFNIVYRNLTNIKYDNLSSDNLATILSNYERLGIIKIDMLNYVGNGIEHYKYVKQSQTFKKLEEYYQIIKSYSSQNIRLDFETGSFSTTVLGESFVQTVFS